MKSKFKTTLIIALLIGSIFGSKDKNKDDIQKPAFNETEMLTNLSANLIVPSYQLMTEDIDFLKSEISNFTTEPNITNLNLARAAWKKAINTWQKVSIFEIGPASEIALRENVNLYPVDTLVINQNIANGTYNLEVVSNYTAKGFQTLDYLLFGISNTDEEVVNYYTTYSNAVNRKKYLNDITTDIHTKITKVNTEWQTYASTFNTSTGTNVGSSIGVLTNQLNFYYERFLRDGKLGIPAGARTFSQTPLPEKSEAYYYNKNSRDLLLESLTTLKKLYKGESLAGVDGKGYDDYLIHLDAKFNEKSLNETIINQIETIEKNTSDLKESLAEESVNNQPKMLSIFDEMQFLNSLLKVEMTNSMEVQITYSDTDGD